MEEQRDREPEDKPCYEPVCWWRWVLTRARGARAIQLAGPIFLVPVLLITVLLVYLGTVGFPEGLTRRIGAQMEDAGFYTSMERLRFNILSGVIADKVEFYNNEQRQESMMKAQRVMINLDPLEWLRGHAGIESLSIAGGEFLLYEAEADGAGRPMELKDIYASLLLEPGGIRIREMTASLLDMHIIANGFVLRSELEAEWNASLIRAPLNRLAEAAPGWYPRLLEVLSRVEFSMPPTLSLDFTLVPDQPEMSEIRLTAEGQQTRIRGARFDRWGITAVLKDALLTVDRAILEQGQQWASVKGKIDLHQQTLEGAMFSDLPIVYWSSLVPSDWYDLLEQQELLFQGPLSWEITIPATSFAQLGDRFTGWVFMKEAELKGVWIEKGLVDFVREPDLFELKKIQATAGREGSRGEVEGSLSINLETKAYTGRFITDCNPRAFVGILEPDEQDIASRFITDEDGRIQMDVTFNDVITATNSFCFEGKLSGTNFVYNGTFADHFSADAVWTNGILSFDDLKLIRDGRLSKGWLKLHFRRDLLEADLEGDINPKALARIAGSKMERIFRFLRIEGPCRMKGSGTIDYDTGDDTAFSIAVDAEDFGTDWFLSGRSTFDLNLVGDDLFITNVVGTYGGGTYQGYGSIYGLIQATSSAFNVYASVTNIELRHVVREVRQETEGPYKGKLTGFLDLYGLIGEDMLGTYTGRGYAVVSNGRLFRFPLFGGLSRMLGRIAPGLGHVSPTDFRSAFVIKDRAFHGKDILLEGDVIRLNADGSYGFEQQLDFNVKVRFLREGAIGKVVELLTIPLTTLLLDFDLGGTLADPKWRPDNLPKELFFIYD